MYAIRSYYDKLADWVSVMGRVGVDWYQLKRKRVNADGSIGVQDGGNFNQSKTYARDFNADLIFNFDKKISKDFGVTGTLGANYRDYTYDYSYFAASSLTVPNLYNINNVSGTVSADQYET